MNRLIAYGLLAVALLGGYAYWQHRTEQRGVQAERARQADLAEQQRMQNRSRARDAELRLSSRQQVVERYFVITEKEFVHATAELASCPLPEPARRMLNDAAKCAREGRPAACQGDGSLPDPAG